MDKTKRFLLVGHSGFYNRGCEAIVRSTTDIIKHTFPDSTIVLISFTADIDREKIKESDIQINNVIPWGKNSVARFSPQWAWQKLQKKLFFPDYSIQDYRHKNLYCNSDVVISIGGDNFSNDYGSPLKYFDTLRVAKSCGTKTVIWGASIGPFSPPDAEKRWAEYLKEVNLITAREDRTVEYLRKLGVVYNVRRVCDPAFILKAIEPKMHVLPDLCNKMSVGIGMSALMNKYDIFEKYLESFKSFIKHLVASYNCNIILVPHVIQEKITRNDFEVCQKLARRLGSECPCYVLPESLNANELKYCISKCDYFIGARTHSTIASLSSLVPTLSIGYSTKAWGINQDLLGCDDYVVDIQSISKEVLIQKFAMLVQNRDNIKKQLASSVPVAKKKAEQAGEYLLSLFD